MLIRIATKADVEIILQLVKKMALYDRKKLEDVNLTLDKIASHGFGKYFDVLLAEYHNQTVGYALYYYTYSASAGAPILYLEDLFIEKKYRNLGLGKALFAKLASLALEKNCCHMEWHAAIWNESGIRFYNSLGAYIKEDLRQFRLEKESLKKIAYLE